jgi:single-strand DNA-binding protein
MSFNKITIVGNLGRDPELRYTPQGNAVCNFTMATNEKRRDKSGESQDVTTWFRITLWGKQAENASKYLTKGSSIYIEGRLRVEEWSDRDGKNRYTLDVHATDMQFIGARGDEMSGGAGNSGASSGGGYSQNDFGDDSHSGGGVSASTPTDDDIPF